jgi:hypothetical protein
LKKDKIELDRNKLEDSLISYYFSICPKFGLSKSGASQFIANQYPTKVPVYYMQGTVDMATPPRGAVQHYKTVPQGEAFLILFIKAGHSPVKFALTAGLEEDSPLKPMTLATLNLFTKAIEGKSWALEDTRDLNISGFKTSFTSK